MSDFELLEPNLIGKILSKWWDGVSFSSTPLPERFKSNFNTGKPGINPADYFLIIGSLNYVSVVTHPDITYLTG